MGGVLPYLPSREEQGTIVDHIASEMGELKEVREAPEGTTALLAERRAALIVAAVAGKIEMGGGKA